jgi:3D (Asp-Asp-Asp) domain-containing protein
MIKIILFPSLMLIVLEMGLAHKQSYYKAVVNNDVVTLTTYSASKKETDGSPNITACGFKIDTLNPRKHKLIAISRDLKKKWKFNSRIRVSNAGRYNGVYVVKDVMNKRWVKRVDILIRPTDQQTKLYNVILTKL